MIDPVALTLSALALAISATTAWLTLFRKGTVKMSQPTVIYFGPDTPTSRREMTLPKVFLRTLLFSTSKRGRVVESLHVTLSRNETHQSFNIWVYGDDKLLRGSGLFVGESGIATNHHFLTPDDASSFRFTEGTYHLNVYARLLGDKSKTLLFSQSLTIDPQIARQILEPHTGLYFDWGPDSSRYIPHVEKRPAPSNLGADKYLDLLGITTQSSGTSV